MKLPGSATAPQPETLAQAYETYERARVAKADLIASVDGARAALAIARNGNGANHNRYGEKDDERTDLVLQHRAGTYLKGRRTSERQLEIELEELLAKVGSTDQALNDAIRNREQVRSRELAIEARKLDGKHRAAVKAMASALALLSDAIESERAVIAELDGTGLNTKTGKLDDVTGLVVNPGLSEYSAILGIGSLVEPNSLSTKFMRAVRKGHF